MPTYNFSKSDGTLVTEFLWTHELDDFIRDNPDLTLGVSDAFAMVDAHRMGRIKTDATFREILGGIKRKYKGSTVET